MSEELITAIIGTIAMAVSTILGAFFMLPTSEMFLLAGACFICEGAMVYLALTD